MERLRHGVWIQDSWVGISIFLWSKNDSSEGEGGMFQKNSMYIIYSETDHQPRWDAWDKCSGLVHCEDPEESGGEGGGRGDRDGECM